MKGANRAKRNSIKPEDSPETEEVTAPKAFTIHEKKINPYSFDRLKKLWESHPQHREMTTFASLEEILMEHESYGEGFDELKEEYVQNHYERLELGYFSSELEFFLCLIRRIMPVFQWWYEDLMLYEGKDGLRTDWRLRRTEIRTRLTKDGIIKPKWKNELTLFKHVSKRYPDTLYQFRPDWLGRQSLDIYIPSLKIAIEYQGIQHYHPVGFFGGEEALSQRQELDEQKKRLCEENGVKLIEWPYSLEPTDKNLKQVLKNAVDPMKR